MLSSMVSVIAKETGRMVFMSDTQDNMKTADQILQETAVEPIPFPYVHVGDKSRREFADNLEKAWLEGNYKIAGSLSHIQGESVTKQLRALIEHDAEKCMDDRYEVRTLPNLGTGSQSRRSKLDLGSLCRSGQSAPVGIMASGEGSKRKAARP
jgi:hypothetical protein